MKLSAILEDDENIVMVPLFWMKREQRQTLIQMGYEVIPISGYHETEGYRAFKIIGKYSDDLNLFKLCSIPIWEDWKLTAKYAADIETDNSTSGQQMFDHLDDDEKIQALTYGWYNDTRRYIKKYFREHPDILKHAKKNLNQNTVVGYFKDLF